MKYFGSGKFITEERMQMKHKELKTISALLKITLYKALDILNHGKSPI